MALEWGEWEEMANRPLYVRRVVCKECGVDCQQCMHADNFAPSPSLFQSGRMEALRATHLRHIAQDTSIFLEALSSVCIHAAAEVV